MRILISIDNYSAHYFIRLGIARAFTVAGHDVTLWDINKKPVYDAFDELEPQLFIGQTYNLNNGLIQCISERPWMKVIMKGADYGYNNFKTKGKYPVLQATEQEIDNVDTLKERVGKPDFIYVHHHPDWLEDTHGYWEKDLGVKTASLLNAADIFGYTNGVYKEEFASDICFIGSRWPYKAQVLDKYLLPLCESNKYNIKIFGGGGWDGIPQYCGHIDDKYVPDILASSKICVNLHEPHSQDLHYDVIERPFKLLSNKCFVLSDEVLGLRRLFPSGEIAFANTPESFASKIDYYLENKRAREMAAEAGYNKTIAHHTYLDRAVQICQELDMDYMVDEIIDTKYNIIQRLKL